VGGKGTGASRGGSRQRTRLGCSARAVENSPDRVQRVRQCPHVATRRLLIRDRPLVLVLCEPLSSLHVALRRANMACSAARERRYVADRAALLEGGEAALRRRKDKCACIIPSPPPSPQWQRAALTCMLFFTPLCRAAEDAAKAQASITSTLRRTRQKMYDEVIRGSETIHSLRMHSFSSFVNSWGRSNPSDLI
jgi:hypothetical protein